MEFSKEIITLLQFFAKYGDEFKKDFMDTWKNQYMYLVTSEYVQISPQLLEGLIVWAQTWEKIIKGEK